MSVASALTNGRNKLLAALAPSDGAEGRPTTSTTTDDPTQEQERQKKLDAIAAWLAGAFGLASTVLVYIGIKDGELDRLLRNEAPDALLVFTLIGLAVAIGVVAPAIDPGAKLRLGLAVALVGTGLVAAAYVLPNLGETPGGDHVIYIGGGIATALAAFLTWGRPVPLKATLLVVGVVLFSTGLYGAFKLAVSEKSIKDRPIITTKLNEAKEGNSTLTVTVKAARLRTEEHLLVAIRGVAGNGEYFPQDQRLGCRPGCHLLFAFRIGGDETGAVDKTAELPLPNGIYQWVAVRADVCAGKARPVQANPATLADLRDDQCTVLRKKTAYLDIRVPNRVLRPRLTLAWKSVDDFSAQLDATITHEALPRDHVVETSVYGLGGHSGYRLVGSAVSAPTGAGRIEAVLPVHLSRSLTDVCVIAEELVASRPEAPPLERSDCAAPSRTSVATHLPIPSAS